jgi:hypothetical protein
MPIEVAKINYQPKAQHTHGLSRFASVVAFNGAARWLRGELGVAVAPYRARTHATGFPEFKARVPSDDRRGLETAFSQSEFQQIQTQQPDQTKLNRGKR